MEYSMDDLHEAMMTPAPTAELKGKEEYDVSKLKSDTQILLAVFEKVVCIEEKLEGMGKHGSAPMQLPTSLMLEGE